MNRNWGSLATAAGLLLAGGWEAFRETSNEGAAALFLASGLIVLGAWLTIEIEDRKKDRGDPTIDKEAPP